MKKITRELENKVCDKLIENNVYADVYMEIPEKVIAVEISWGDWKHEHLRADWLMKDIGFTKLNTVVTEEDGSDTYSAIHYYCMD